MAFRSSRWPTGSTCRVRPSTGGWVATRTMACPASWTDPIAHRGARTRWTRPWRCGCSRSAGATPTGDRRRLVDEASRAGVEPLPSRSGIYPAPKLAGMIDPPARRLRDRRFRRWERGGPMELWQMDVVGGVLLADGTECKVLTGIDDHSRFVVCSGVMARATSRAVCVHFAEALRCHGVPQKVLTDNGKVFTGRFGHKDVEVL